MAEEKRENNWLYTLLGTTEKDAQKPIQAGRLKGMTDINPMFRIKRLTEVFGACGEGWYIDNIKYELIPCEPAKEVVCLCQLDLFYKTEDGKWSEPIKGIGGSKLLIAEKTGAYCNDEAYKMAYTDAISIACKALGMCADIYYSKDRTKYDLPESTPAPDTTNLYAYMSQEMARIDNTYGEGTFKRLRQLLITEGTIQDKGAKELTMKDFKHIVNLITFKAIAEQNGKMSPDQTEFFSVKKENKDA